MVSSTNLVATSALLLLLVASGAVAQSPPAARPSIESSDYDAAGRFRVNGRPFFPILLYGVPTDDASLTVFREFGFNVLACRPEESDSLPGRGLYAAVHSGKMPVNTSSVFLAIGADSPALYFKRDLLAETAEANAKTAAAIPHRPLMNAIGYWEDEPAGVVAGKLPSKAKYDDLVAAIDVAAPYLYPVPYQPITSVGDAVARARKANGGKKPILPILQLFAWDEQARYPTPDELRYMTLLALVEGASGIGYYSYNTAIGKAKTTIADVEPELWQSVKKLNHEVVTIGPRLLYGEPDRDFVLAEANPAIRFKAVRDRKRTLALVVNTSAEKQSLKLRGDGTIELAPFGVLYLEGRGTVADVRSR